jgi:dTDP-L-rhamnose 4-epimerase
MRVLVTGAAGFVGSAVAREFTGAGHDVVGVDAYLPQAHGAPAHQDGRVPDVRTVDVGDARALRPLMRGVDAVCHQAAIVGAEVTAADLPLFARHNDLATATLLAAMADASIGSLVLASSMVVYGDGRYRCAEHEEQRPSARRLSELEAGHFDMRCPVGGEVLDWMLVDEASALAPRSGYAASKVAQEHFVTAWARQTGSRAVALRYHNVYGPGMPRSSPYSGVAAMFRSALERGEPPLVFEDGGQMRDFVHVSDVARANLLAMDYACGADDDSFAAFNVCSGTPISIADVARSIVTPVRGKPPEITGRFRPGDVRHIVASPDRATAVLGFKAGIAPHDGLSSFATDPLRAM